MLNFPPTCADMVYLHFSAYSGPKFLLKSFLNRCLSQPFKIAISPSVLPIVHCSLNLTVNILSFVISHFIQNMSIIPLKIPALPPTHHDPVVL